MNKTTKEQFEKWLDQIEDIDLEFKLAANSFSSSGGSLFDYCAAISNGRGGKLILGVQEKPREVKGTNFMEGTHTKLAHEIWERQKIHVDVEEFLYEGKRTLILHIPKHPLATRIKSGCKNDKYTYPIRRGESLGEMDDQKTREILNESQSDLTAETGLGLIFEDLDPAALEDFKRKWAQKAHRDDYLAFSDEKMLTNLGLMVDGRVSYAALILVGRKESIKKHLPDAEIIFEWRHDSKQTHHDFRETWREPFVMVDAEIWKAQLSGKTFLEELILEFVQARPV